MRQVKGSELSQEEQRKALARFVHRFTKQHRPQWANTPRPNGKPYKVQFASDADWLANSLFFVTKEGWLSQQHNHCESTPTWPEGMS